MYALMPFGPPIFRIRSRYNATRFSELISPFVILLDYVKSDRSVKSLSDNDFFSTELLIEAVKVDPAPPAGVFFIDVLGSLSF